MRIALLQLPEGDLAEAKLAGRTLSEYQVEFALMAGCERIIVIAPRASKAAFELQQTAEKGGARFQVIADSRTLLGMVHSEDQVLLMARNLLPLSPATAEILSDRPVVLTVPDGSDLPAAHERIDRDTFWAGALLLPGRLADRLSELPDDADIQSALLRIALQAGVPKAELQVSVSPTEDWMLASSAQQLGERNEALFRHVGEGELPPTSMAASAIVRRFGATLIGDGKGPIRCAGTSLTIAAFGGLIAWFGLIEAGFLFLAIACIVARVSFLLADRMPGKSAAARPEIIGWALDAVLIFLLMLGLYDLYYRWGEVWYLPVVTVGLLRLAASDNAGAAGRLLGDRGLWAIIFAVLSYFRALEFGLEVVSVLLLAAILFDLPKRVGITAN